MDALYLSRFQFAFTIMFHYLFPPLTIGMGLVLVYLEGMYLRTKEPIYESAAKFWTSLYAVTFAMGVATGIVMEFEFGTNWAVYSRFVGDVFGSALAAEGIFAFFLESGFLAVLVFGWDKVSPRFHFLATTMVALGSTFSAVWIIVANSWQQTPAGHKVVPVLKEGQPWLVNGQPMMRAETADFWTVIFSPSSLDRLAHTLIGAYIVGAFFVISISAWYLLKRKHVDFARRSLTGALILATFWSCAQLVSGHSNSRMVASRQPAKLAAFEGHFETGPAALHLIGIPDADERRVKYGIAIPGMLSFLVHDDVSKPVWGLDKIRREFWPPLVTTFMSYHLMIGVGMYLIGLTLFASFLRWRNKLFEQRWLLWVLVVSIIGPVAANEAGWVAAEVGRQPWIVHPPLVRDVAGQPVLDSAGMLQYMPNEGLLTSKAVSEAIQGEHVLASIIMFGIVYALLFFIWIYVLNDKIQKGPQPVTIVEGGAAHGWLDAASERTAHRGTMSEAKDETAG
ncbi:MAG: cytochrome ubiquinol oxidase subunit I [Bryobacterales bacterium]|nr:cytochrome ubiquinol oxidase subunit I [Bryobacterales bacterium]